MGPSWQDIVTWRPEALNDATEELRRVSGVVAAQTDEVAAALAGFRSTGETADVVRERLQEHQEVLADLAKDVDRAYRGVAAAVDQVREVQRLVAEVLDHVAVRPHVVIDAHGHLATVDLGLPGEDLGPVQELVHRALALAVQVDTDLLVALGGQPQQARPTPRTEPTNSLIGHVLESGRATRPPSLREQYPDLERSIPRPPVGGFSERKLGPQDPSSLS
ncbi:hypothetical protein EII34_06340 [Arachnia propionica]|uniref:Uncharacterized protein n=1 Tax=Arachnia propionica TaxID=1750 RepID=A0A3P1T7H4_9ACTN|nr:hypothetical protein [Arachnia propionica]RRD05349.1 hypothetical protein EII34_06340 [Arachnia propionica]